MRKGPGLAAKVPNVLDLETGLLSDLPDDGLFERLAGFDKPGHHTVTPGWVMVGPNEKNLRAAFHKDDNSRGKTGEMKETALRTFLGPFGRQDRERIPAPAAKLVCPIPIKDLGRTTCHPKQILIDEVVDFAEIQEVHACRGLDALRQFSDITVTICEPAQVMVPGRL
jgi:hypothetical protein